MSTFVPINNDNPYNSYTATAGQTDFIFSWYVFKPEFVKVYKNEVLLTYISDYTIPTGSIGQEDGGNITLTSPAEEGDIIIISRESNVERLTGFTQFGDWNAKSINNEFNYIITLIQEVILKFNQSVKIPTYDAETTSDQLVIPPLQDRVSKFLGFDSFGSFTAVDGNSSIELNILDEDDFISNNDSYPPTQQSTKAYVDNNISTVNAELTNVNAELTNVNAELTNVNEELDRRLSIGDMKHGQLQQSNHNGWLLWAEGVNLSKTTYATLWAWAGTNSLIGTLGEAGKFFIDIDGSNFQLQGLSGRALGASGSGSGLTSRGFGAKTGAETHTLTIDEMPSHTHETIVANQYGGWSSATYWMSTNNASPYTDGPFNTGGDQPHNNMQPTTFLNTFIYAGV